MSLLADLEREHLPVAPSRVAVVLRVTGVTQVGLVQNSLNRHEDNAEIVDGDVMKIEPLSGECHL
jgi:hypothetical protein